MSGRAIRCRYVRTSGNTCENEAAGQGDEEVVLCAKHLYRAHQLFMELSQKAAP